MKEVETMLDKEKVIELKRKGKSYKEIANELGVPVGSIKSTLSRITKVVELKKESPKCKNCGCEINLVKGKKKREFCSNKCRTQYWLKHQKERKCKCCSNLFTPNSRSNQFFCSRECYLKYVKNGGGSNES